MSLVLTNSIESGNLKEVIALLAETPSLLSTPNDLGDYPINTACEMKAYAIVEYLLDIGADPNSRGDFARTPLYNAINSGGKDSIPIVKLLIARGADMNLKDESGYDLRTWARLEMGAGGGYEEIRDLLGDS